MKVSVLSPYNKEGRLMAVDLINKITSRIAPVELAYGDNADCVVAVDLRPQELGKLASEAKYVVLVPAQPRNAQGLNTYLRECDRFTNPNDRDKVVVAQVNYTAERLIDRMWHLNTTLFGLSNDYDY